MCIFFGQQSSTQKRIVIDVGHGGKDSGAVGINKIQEKEVVLDIANAILELNNGLDNPLDIYLTRYSDTLFSLLDRTKLAKALKADLFVSLHCNHSDNANARGVEVFVANKESVNQHDSTWLAFQLQDMLNKTLGFESRGVKFANFQVLRDTIDYCNSIIVEMGFLSNLDEESYFTNDINLKALAHTILNFLKVASL